MARDRQGSGRSDLFARFRSVRKDAGAGTRRRTKCPNIGRFRLSKRLAPQPTGTVWPGRRAGRRDTQTALGRAAADAWIGALAPAHSSGRPVSPVTAPSTSTSRRGRVPGAARSTPGRAVGGRDCGRSPRNPPRSVTASLGSGRRPWPGPGAGEARAPKAAAALRPCRARLRSSVSGPYTSSRARVDWRSRLTVRVPAAGS